jgi:hypothetical protein
MAKHLDELWKFYKISPKIKNISIGEKVPRPGVERTGIERPGIERPGIERPGIERLGIKLIGVEQPGVEYGQGSNDFITLT